MGGGNGVEIAGKVQVDVFHGHHLGIAAAGRAAFDTETGTQRGLAQGNDNFFPDFLQPLGQTYRRGRFPFPGRSRGNGCHQHQLSRFPVFHFADQIVGKFGFIFSVQLQIFLINPQFFRNLRNRQHFYLLGNLDIRQHGNSSFSYSSPCNFFIT